MKLTKRGKRVRAVAILIGIYSIAMIATHFWWSANGPCWGSMQHCVGL
jgi:hypothetical protein